MITRVYPRSLIGAVFYRHWLEVRAPALILSVVIPVAAVGYGFAVAGTAGYFSTSGKLTEQVARYQAISQMGAGPELIAAVFHALVAAFFGLLTSATFAGEGNSSRSVRASSQRHPSVYFTASLPISRSVMQLTRLAAGFASLLAALGLSLVFHVIALLIIRQPVPIAVMTGTTLMAAVGGLGLMAFAGLITVITSGVLGGLLMFGVVMALWLTDSGWDRTIAFVSPQASLFGAAVLAAAAMAALSVVFARRKDL